MADALMKRLGVAMLKLTAALTGVEIHVSDDFVKMYASSFLDVPTLSMESVLEVLRRPTINFDLPVPEVFESLQRFAKGTSDPEIDTQTVLERFESRNNNGVGKDLDNALSGADDEKLKLLKIGYDVFNRPPSSNDDKRPPCTEDDVYRLLSSRAPGPVSATQLGIELMAIASLSFQGRENGGGKNTKRKPLHSVVHSLVSADPHTRGRYEVLPTEHDTFISLTYTREAREEDLQDLPMCLHVTRCVPNGKGWLHGTTSQKSGWAKCTTTHLLAAGYQIKKSRVLSDTFYAIRPPPLLFAGVHPAVEVSASAEDAASLKRVLDFASGTVPCLPLDSDDPPWIKDVHSVFFNKAVEDWRFRFWSLCRLGEALVELFVEKMHPACTLEPKFKAAIVDDICSSPIPQRVRQLLAAPQDSYLNGIIMRVIFASIHLYTQAPDTLSIQYNQCDEVARRLLGLPALAPFAVITHTQDEPFDLARVPGVPTKADTESTTVKATHFGSMTKAYRAVSDVAKLYDELTQFGVHDVCEICPAVVPFHFVLQPQSNGTSKCLVPGSVLLSESALVGSTMQVPCNEPLVCAIQKVLERWTGDRARLVVLPNDDGCRVVFPFIPVDIAKIDKILHAILIRVAIWLCDHSTVSPTLFKHQQLCKQYEVLVSMCVHRVKSEKPLSTAEYLWQLPFHRLVWAPYTLARTAWRRVYEIAPGGVVQPVLSMRELFDLVSCRRYEQWTVCDAGVWSPPAGEDVLWCTGCPQCPKKGSS